MKIRGRTVSTPMPRSDWEQADPRKADYIKNKPTEMEVVRGYSAYQVAVMNGFKGTEAEWLASLVGPPGPAGEAGKVTINGIPPDDNGDFKIPGVTEDEDGNLIFPGGGTGNGTVTSVNGNLPDEDGNVEVDIPEIDATLSKPGAAADAEMTGIAFQTVGVGAWEGILSMAETLAALVRKTKHIKVTESSSNINITETMEDNALLYMDIALDSNEKPTSITVNGYTFPVEWSGTGG